MRIAVVGHTNTGKTSLVCTLLRRQDFGAIRDAAGTTRQVTSAGLEIDGELLIELYDSPGLENAPELIEWLESVDAGRHAGPERISALLESVDGRVSFDHEARVLELLLEADIALYVVDVREPVLEKYLDELTVLGWCARPLIVVLNFTASPASRETEWRDALARIGLHAVLAFDAVVRDPETEFRLYEKLKSLLDSRAGLIERWMAHRREEEAANRQAAIASIAELLVDVAAARRVLSLEVDVAASPALAKLRQTVRRAEQACVDGLLDLYRFRAEDYLDGELPLVNGSWPEDLFDPETLRHHGISTGKHLGLGAGAGALFDLGTAGLSLGAGTLIGAAAGTGAGLVRNFGARLIERARGHRLVGIDDDIICLLAARQLELLDELIRRGHASQHPVAAGSERLWSGQRLPSPLRQARFHPDWSRLNEDQGFRESTARSVAIRNLAGNLAESTLRSG